MKHVLRVVVPAALSALLLWAVYPPMGEVCALAFALVPLLVASRLGTPKRAAQAWFLGGFLFWFATLAWMPAIVKNDGPLPLVVLGWAGLAALCAGYFALFGWLCARAWSRLSSVRCPASTARAGDRLASVRRPASSVCAESCLADARQPASPVRKLLLILFVEPVLWAGIEWVRSWLFTGFAWNFLGTALGQVPSLAAPARLGGVYLVSALVVLLNGVFATLACRLWAQMRPQAAGEEGAGASGAAQDGGRLAVWRLAFGGRWGRMCETALPLGLILLAFGLANLSLMSFSSGGAGALREESSVLALRVALVQRNAPCIFARRERAEDPYEAFGRLLAVASAARPDLVVWAESAMAEFGRLDSDGARRAALFVSRKAGGASLLAGGDWVYRVQEGGEEARRVWNAAALYTPAGTNVALQVYGKQHLVPFGEYIPFDKWIPPLQRLSPVGVSIWPGEAKTLRLRLNREEGAASPTVALAPLICYEDTDPVLSRRAARLGAQAIVLITNDSWFSHSQEPVQHAWQAVLRAIETGLPVVRAGNSGVTGVVYPSGRTRWLEDGEGRPLVDAAGTMVESVSVVASPALTPYVRLGDWPLAALFAACLALVFYNPKKECP